VKEESGAKMSLVLGELAPLDQEGPQILSSGDPVIQTSFVRELGGSRVATGRTTVKKKGGSSRRSASHYRSRYRVRTCTNCNKTGHDRRNCSKLRIDSNGSIIVSQRRCTRCGSLRHDKRMCTLSMEDAKRKAAEETGLSRRQFALLAQQQKKAAVAATASSQSNVPTTKVPQAPPPQNPNPWVATAAAPPLPTEEQPMPPYRLNTPNYGCNPYQGIICSSHGEFLQNWAMQNLYAHAQSIHYYEVMQKQMKLYMESKADMPTMSQVQHPSRQIPVHLQTQAMQVQQQGEGEQVQQMVTGSRLETVMGTMAAAYTVYAHTNSWGRAQMSLGRHTNGKTGLFDNEDASDDAARILLSMGNK